MVGKHVGKTEEANHFSFGKTGGFRFQFDHFLPPLVGCMQNQSDLLRMGRCIKEFVSWPTFGANSWCLKNKMKRIRSFGWKGDWSFQSLERVAGTSFHHWNLEIAWNFSESYMDGLLGLISYVLSQPVWQDPRLFRSIHQIGSMWTGQPAWPALPQTTARLA